MASKLRDDIDKSVEPGQLEAFFWIVISQGANLSLVNRRLDALVMGSGSSLDVGHERGSGGASYAQKRNESASTDSDESMADESGSVQAIEGSSSAGVVNAPVPAFPISDSCSARDEAAYERSAGSGDVAPTQLDAGLAALSLREGSTAPNTEVAAVVSGGDGSSGLGGDTGADVAGSCIEAPAYVRVARPPVECADKELQCELFPTYRLSALMRLEMATRVEVLRRHQAYCERLKQRSDSL
ncbi:hypothetical protein V5799_024551 [Amblyomma americanum]|uniref:Uncharacterized protein n=1 Tax=Amblyomma americanum TaxID=6943 RepID=A0AAQ4EBR6_AMBAM